MNAISKSNDAILEKLCPACGLCCSGVIFADVGLQRRDDAARLRSLGLPVSVPRSALRPPHLAQPCAAFDGCRCRVYADRPQYCREFECVLLQSVKTGHTQAAAALRIIRTARERADKVRRLLNAPLEMPMSSSPSAPASGASASDCKSGVGTKKRRIRIPNLPSLSTTSICC